MASLIRFNERNTFFHPCFTILLVVILSFIGITAFSWGGVAVYTPADGYVWGQIGIDPLIATTTQGYASLSGTNLIWDQNSDLQILSQDALLDCPVGSSAYYDIIKDHPLYIPNGALSIDGGQMHCLGMTGKNQDAQSVNITVSNGGRLETNSLKIWDYRLMNVNLGSITADGSSSKIVIPWTAEIDAPVPLIAQNGGQIEIGSLDLSSSAVDFDLTKPNLLIADGVSSEIILEKKVEIGHANRIYAKNGGRIWGGERWTCYGEMDVSEGGGIDIGATGSPDVEDGMVRIRENTVAILLKSTIFGNLTLDSGSTILSPRARDIPISIPIDFLDNSTDIITVSDFTLSGNGLEEFGLPLHLATPGLGPQGTLLFHVTGDATMQGTIMVGELVRMVEGNLETMQGKTYDVIQVDGYCDWNSATINTLPYFFIGTHEESDYVYFTMHEHGLTMTVVPEPSTIVLLLGLAMIGLFFVRKK